MAGVALGFGHRIMNACLEKFHLQGGMGVVAARAQRLIDRVIAMALFESRFIAVMTAKAEGSLRLHQRFFDQNCGRMAMDAFVCNALWTTFFS
jgi:hypothetical protein